MSALETIRSEKTATADREMSTVRHKMTVRRIGYLLSQYPAVSHTFFLHEVLGMRGRGLHIETASINPPDRDLSALPEEEANEARTTRYIKSGSRPKALGELIAAAVTTPSALWRGLRAWAAIPKLTSRQRLHWLFYLAEAVLVGRWIRQRSLDHLHVHFGGPVASVGMLTAKMWGIPFSLTIHGPEELLNHEAYHLREKIEAAQMVLCISDFCRSQLCLLTPPADWDKFKVVRLGVDPVVLAPHRASPANAATAGSGSSGGRGQMQTPERALELVSTGRMVPEKGHRVLIEALVLLRARGILLRATLVGGGPELNDLRRLVAERDLAGQVTFTGPLSHALTLQHLRRADLFALASFAEGIPVAIMEAMSFGVACVGTSIAGIPELIRTSVDGLLVPPGNACAMADALAQLALDPALRRQLGNSARQRILSHYNLPLNHELLAQAFAEFGSQSEEQRGRVR
jgi:glycosyltransferase involved in cell wall biosynthesis